MGSGHDHGQAHGGKAEGNQRRLAITMVLVAGYMVAEVVGGLLTNSLALLADAAHMLSDVAALALSLFAIWVARRPSSPRHTYGYYRTEILAALINGATLVAVAIYVFVEAYHRIGEPPEVEGALMMGIAVGGLLINLIGLWVLNGGRKGSLNVEGAWLHVLTDALGSVGAIVAGGLIWAFGWNWVDPLVSVGIGLLVLYSSWSLLRETVAVLMEGAPGHIDVDTVRDALQSLPEVTSVHDLHVWTVTSGIVALSAHVGVAAAQGSPELLSHIHGLLEEQFGINHSTIQLEPEGYPVKEMPV